MIRKMLIFSCMALAAVSCTKNFSSINVNPTAPASVPLDYTFGQCQLFYAGSAGDPGYTQWRANLIYSMPMIQQTASLGTFYSGDKYLLDAANGSSGAYFGTSDGEGNYPNAVKNLVQLIASARQDSVTNVNVLSMARILKVLLMSTMTDLYGDIPYFNAGKGYLSSIYSPAFDPQSAIYPDMLNELSQAGAALNASAYIPAAADFAYGGNITSWKHLANSLMLRLAMRLTNADPVNAQKWAAQAISGGIMTGNAESYAIKFVGGSGGNTNPISYNLGPSDATSYRQIIQTVNGIQWSNTFIGALKSRQDPRLHQIATILPAGTPVPLLSTLGDTVGTHQLGLPNGLDQVPGSIPLTGYSVMNPLTFTSTAPLIIVTYAEMQFLAAEAFQRGWATGSAATAFANGQAAALQQMASYTSSFMPTASSVTAYQAANPYPAGVSTTPSAAQMNAIYTEVWILTACTYNGMEGWADWRRTGYPVLKPVNYVGNVTGGTIPRRLQYPGEESSLDATGYQQAVGHMGPDLFTTKMWWDGGKP